MLQNLSKGIQNVKKIYIKADNLINYLSYWMLGLLNLKGLLIKFIKIQNHKENVLLGFLCFFDGAKEGDLTSQEYQI